MKKPDIFRGYREVTFVLKWVNVERSFSLLVSVAWSVKFDHSYCPIWAHCCVSYRNQSFEADFRPSVLPKKETVINVKVSFCYVLGCCKSSIQMGFILHSSYLLSNRSNKKNDSPQGVTYIGEQWSNLKLWLEMPLWIDIMFVKPRNITVITILQSETIFSKLYQLHQIIEH